MELVVANDLVIKCCTCGEKHIIDKESLDINTYSYERQMGDEVEYIFSGETNCINCGAVLSYIVRGYEYPVGCLNYEDYESEGCIFLQEPSLDVNYFEFEYDGYFEDYISDAVEWVQANIERVLQREDRIYQLSPREFEEIVAEIFRKQGFDVILTQETRDGGSDIIATHDMGNIPFMVLVECKKYGPNNKVGVSLVRSLLGVQTDQKANKAVLVTTSSFTRDAKIFAERQKHLITLVDCNELLKMMRNSR